MQRLKIPFVIMLTLVLVLSSAVVASAAKPDHAGGKGRGKADVALTVDVAETDAATANPVHAGTEEGTSEEGTTNPYDLSQMLEQIEAIKASLPGKGNAWGRIAKELGLEKAPGSIATLVEQLKQLVGHVDDAEDAALPEITETVTVAVVNIEVDDEGNETGMITIAWPGAVEGEEPITYTIEVSEELRAQLEAGTQLDLSIDEAGDLLMAIHEEPATTEAEPTADATTDGTTAEGDTTDGTTTEGTDTTDDTAV